jgi:hypothetical protein
VLDPGQRSVSFPVLECSLNHLFQTSPNVSHAGRFASKGAYFLEGLSATGNDMGACGFYLEQLKACQSMASQY